MPQSARRGTKSGDMIILTGWQVRACRAMLRLSIEELSRRSGVSDRSIRRIEAEDEPVNATTDLIARLVRYFEGQGFSFAEGDDQRGPGIFWNRYVKRGN